MSLGIGIDPVSNNAAAFKSLAQFQANLRKMKSQTTANKIAAAAAPVITELAKETFAAGENPYGNTWEPKADGTRATLRDEGKLFDGTKYVATGTKIRVKLVDPKYRYVIGKRPIFPTQGGSLPVQYTRALSRLAVDICKAEFES